MKLTFIRLRRSVENSNVERVHDKFRADCPDLHWLPDTRDAGDIITAWQDDQETVCHTLP